jgi:hypothetical protein
MRFTGRPRRYGGCRRGDKCASGRAGADEFMTTYRTAIAAMPNLWRSGIARSMLLWSPITRQRNRPHSTLRRKATPAHHRELRVHLAIERIRRRHWLKAIRGPLKRSRTSQGRSDQWHRHTKLAQEQGPPFVTAGATSSPTGQQRWGRPEEAGAAENTTPEVMAISGRREGGGLTAAFKKKRAAESPNTGVSSPSPLRVKPSANQLKILKQ